MLRQPGNGLLNHLCDVLAVRCDYGLLLQPAMEVYMLGFRDGVFQIIVVIRKAGIGLNLADAVRLENGRYRNAVVS